MAHWGSTLCPQKVNKVISGKKKQIAEQTLKLKVKE